MTAGIPSGRQTARIEIAPPKRLVTVPTRTESDMGDRLLPDTRLPIETTVTPPMPSPVVSAPPAPPAGAVPLDRTRLLIQDMWNTAEFENHGVQPEPVAEADSMLDKRGWARRLGAGLLVVGVGLLAWGFYSLWTDRPSDAVSEATARTELTAALAGLRPVLADFADGAPVDQAATPLAIDQASTAAKRLFTAAAGIDDPTARSQATSDAQQVLEVTDVLSRISSYQAALGPVLLDPDLSAAGDEIQMAELLATWQSELQNVVAVLPTGPETGSIDSQLVSFSQEFDLWKVSMLDALREGHDIAPLISDLGSRLEVLRSQIDALLEDTAAGAAARLAPLG